MRIKAGTLRGIVGVLTEFKGDYRLVVSLTLLRRSVAVEIDSALVSPDLVSVPKQPGGSI